MFKIIPNINYDEIFIHIFIIYMMSELSVVQFVFCC